MTPEQLRDERDAEMLAKIRPPWLVQWTQAGLKRLLADLEREGLEQQHIDMYEPYSPLGDWWIVLSPVVDGRVSIFAPCDMPDERGDRSVPISEITALHPPTDNPQMETAYKLREPPTITREQVAERLAAGWGIEVDGRGQEAYLSTWYRVHRILGDGGFVVKNGAWGTWLVSGNTAITAIRSPGGNVYEIVKDVND